MFERTPRLEIRKIVYQKFVAGATFIEIRDLLKSRGIEVSLEELSQIIKDRIDLLTDLKEDERTKLLKRLASFVDVGFIKIDQPLIPFLKALLKKTNEESLEIITRLRRLPTAYAAAQVISLIQMMAKLKEQIEKLEQGSSGQATVSVDMLDEYHFKFCECLVEVMSDTIKDPTIRKQFSDELKVRLEKMKSEFLSVHNLTTTEVLR